ncbi:hypothetical protein [Spongiactinospora sp. 9N601]|uniref:hypothetical protein n=1 Tax=Spongiactinospora sp. 9N601 TaxID=3375149 RepID=UPI0037ACBAF7
MSKQTLCNHFGDKERLIAESGRHPRLLEEWTRPGAVMEQALAEAITRQAHRGILDVPDTGLAGAPARPGRDH